MSVVRTGCSDIIQEICRIPWFTCSFPFQYKDNRFSLSIWRFVIGYALSFAIAYVLIIVQSMPSNVFETMKFLEVMHFFWNVATKAFLTVSPVWLLWKRKLLNDLCGSLNDVDMFLVTNGYFWKFRVKYFKDVGIFTILLIPSLINLYKQPFTTFLPLRECANLATPFFMYVIIFFFKRLILMFTSGYTLLKEYLMILPISNNITFRHNKYDVVLLNAHRLYYCSYILNQLLSPQLFLILSASFFGSTTKIFLAHKNIYQDKLESVKQLVLSVIYLNMSILLVSPCSRIQTEVRKNDLLFYYYSWILLTIIKNVYELKIIYFRIYKTTKSNFSLTCLYLGQMSATIFEARRWSWDINFSHGLLYIWFFF